MNFDKFDMSMDPTINPQFVENNSEKQSQLGLFAAAQCDATLLQDFETSQKANITKLYRELAPTLDCESTTHHLPEGVTSVVDSNDNITFISYSSGIVVKRLVNICLVKDREQNFWLMMESKKLWARLD